MSFWKRKKRNKITKRFITYANILKKEGRLSMGVTSILRLPKCPLQSVFYSHVNPFRTRLDIPISFLTGTISHFCFDLHYDNLDKTLIELIDLGVEHLKKERPVEYAQFLDKKEKILTNVFKYVRSFRKWATLNSIPFKRELYLKYGFVEGVIDRLDIVGGKFIPVVLWEGDNNPNKYWWTDYKTASSFPNKEKLIDYEIQTAGGYGYLLHHSLQLDLDTLLDPRLLVVRKGSCKTHIPERWERYLEDFTYIVEELAKTLIALVHGRIPEYKISKECDFCQGKELCANWFR